MASSVGALPMLAIHLALCIHSKLLSQVLCWLPTCTVCLSSSEVATSPASVAANACKDVLAYFRNLTLSGYFVSMLTCRETGAGSRLHDKLSIEYVKD
jgi:hypothetical protein